MEVFLLIMPMFALVLVGWLLSAIGFLSEKVGDGLAEYVFSLAVPALIINTLSQPGPSTTVHAGYWIAYFGGCAIVWAIVARIASRWLRLGSSREAVIHGFASSQSNTVFFGIPIILSLFGDEGRVPLFLLLAVHLPIMMAAVSIFLERGEGGAGFALVWHLVKVLSRNPIVIALGVGAAMRAGNVVLPTLPQQLVDAIAATASTCALLSLGVSLTRYNVLKGLAGASVISVGKLIVHPLLVWVLAYHVFSMPPAFAGVATMFAAMPVGVNSYLLAARYGMGEAATSSAVVLSTVVSILTIPVWIYCVQLP